MEDSQRAQTSDQTNKQTIKKQKQTNKQIIYLIFYSSIRNSTTQTIQGQKEHHASSNYCVRNRETEKCCESDLHVTENQHQKRPQLEEL